MVLVSRNGEGHILSPKVKSDFTGIMYPPGYLVITDNLEYIQDEDDLDQVVEAHEEDEEEDVDMAAEQDVEDELDEDLKEALRQSLLEQ